VLIFLTSQRYTGHTQNRLVLRSCFGGVSDAFILGGSEDGRVCLWHRKCGDLLEVCSELTQFNFFDFLL
jgi:hypothetical protein